MHVLQPEEVDPTMNPYEILRVFETTRTSFIQSFVAWLRRFLDNVLLMVALARDAAAMWFATQRSCQEIV